MGKQSMRVQEDPENPVEKGVLAQAIVNISKAAQKLHQDGLNQKAIVILLHHSTKIPMRDIQLVLENIRTLEQQYCE